MCLDKGKKGKESLDFLGKFCERKKPPLKGFFLLLFLFGILLNNCEMNGTVDLIK